MVRSTPINEAETSISVEILSELTLKMLNFFDRMKQMAKINDGIAKLE